MRKLHVQLECSRSPFSGYISSTYVRLLQPLSHPANEDAFAVSMGGGRLLPGTDIVLVERIWNSKGTVEDAAALIEQVREAGASLIYTVDDNLLDWPGGTIAQRSALALFAREADGVIVSTAALADRFRELNPNIYLVPNAVDERLFGAALKHRRKFAGVGGLQRIGYMGTVTHDSDLLMIAEALRSVCRRRRNKIELQLIGAVNKGSTFKALEGVPVRILRVKSHQEAYPRFVAWMVKNMHFDFGIAPLQDNIFTKSKSDLKFLDYGALGIPGIFSRMSVYLETVRHGETGYLAENTTEAWEAGLDRMLDDHSLRQSIAANVQRYVFEQRSLKQHAQDWQNAICEIYEQRATRAAGAQACRSLPNVLAHRDLRGIQTHPIANVDLIVRVCNRPFAAARCIESLLTHTTYPHWRLLLVDDQSDAATSAMLQRYAAQCANIKYFRNDACLGLVGSYNRGIALSDSKYVAFLQPDIVVSPGWLEKLVAVAEADRSIALVNPLCNSAGRLSLPMPPGMSYMAVNEALERETDGKAFDIVAARRDCLLVRREALERHGAFDPAFEEGSCEDADLHMRLTSNGWRAVAAPNVYVHRYDSATRGSKSNEDCVPTDVAVFRERWGVRYDLDFKRFQEAGLTYGVHALFGEKSVRKETAASKRAPIMPRVTHLLRICTRIPGLVYRNYQNIPTALIHPRYVLSVLKNQLRGASGDVKRRYKPPVPYEEMKLTRDYFDYHTRRQSPSVVFVLQGISGYGECASVLRIVDQLIVLGIEARAAVVQRTPLDAETLREFMFAPMIFKDSDELVKNLPACHVAVATSWKTASWVQKVVEAGRAETSVYDLPDGESWLCEKEEDRQKICESHSRIEHRVAASHWLRDWLRERGADARIIPHGFDPFRFYPHAKRERANLRIIVTTRPETPHRDCENMVEAFRLIHQARPHVEFVLHGTDNLSQTFGKFGLPYSDLGVVRHTDELCKHYNECDIFVDPSHYQGFGQAALESMACRLACVLTNVGGVHEYAKDGVNCLLIPPRDPEACCNAVLRLIDDSELRLRLAANGRHTVEQMPMREEGRAWADFLAEISPGFRTAYREEERRQAAA